MGKNRNLWLDLFKLVLCWMIICIHFVGETYSYYSIYRLAVPMYFAISGYFNFRTEGRRESAAAFARRSFRYMLLGFGFYILFDFVMCYINGNGVGYYFTTLFYEDFLLEFVFLNRPITYTGAQLWFLIALFMVSLVHYALVRFDKLHWYRWIVPVTLAIQLFFGGYMRLLQHTDMPIRYTRNGWFMGLPFFGLGYLLAQLDFHKKWWYKFIYLVLGVAFAFLQIREGKLVETEVYITTVPAVVFMLLFFTGLKSPKADWYYCCFGKDMSFWVYVLHMAVGVVLEKLCDFQTPLEKSFAVLGVSVVVYVLGFWIVKGYRRLKA